MNNFLQMKKIALALLLLGILLSACRQEEKMRDPLIANFSTADGLDKILLYDSTTTDPGLVSLKFTWSADNKSLQFASSDILKCDYFKIPAATQGSVIITVKASDGNNSSVATQTISLPLLTPVRSMGLGKSLIKEVSNDVAYPWYLDQYYTGQYSYENCGPASVTMAIKWANQDFSNTAEDARNTYRAQGGWWYTDDVTNYLDDFKISNGTINLTSMDDVVEQVDQGNILILCLDMFYVEALHPDGVSEYHFDKFYQTNNVGWGHFIVIKGYKYVDDQLFLEAYDPYGWGEYYSDQVTSKGQNRYYKSSSLNAATQNWWKYAIVVSRNPLPDGGRVITDKRMIPTQSGK